MKLITDEKTYRTINHIVANRSVFAEDGERIWLGSLYGQDVHIAGAHGDDL